MTGELSGKFVLRLPPPLHARLAATAQSAGLSLNEHCVRRLAAAEAGPRDALRRVVASALQQLGPDLVGAAVFGSWARGEATSASDVDVLFVVRRSVEITRSLYSAWDVTDVSLDGYPVEPHYVQLPIAEDAVSGFWAEIAIEGSIVFDPDFVLSHELVRIRRAIVDGLLVRRSAGGQSWWTAA
jgi:predicted nucleotidyltransferase